MNTNMMELNMNEMEQVIGGGAVHQAARKKIKKTIEGWITETAAPFCVASAKAAYNIGKKSIEWVKGLFD